MRCELKCTTAERNALAAQVLAATGMTLAELAENNYHLIYADADGNVHALLPLMFTVAIVADLDRYGYGDRWCYATEAEALTAYAAWIDHGCTGEPAGWVRHPKSGRRWVKAENFCEINSF